MEWAGDLINCGVEGADRARLFACIEVPFSSIVGLSTDTEGQRLLVEVGSRPNMFMGSKPCDQAGEHMWREMINYVQWYFRGFSVSLRMPNCSKVPSAILLVRLQHTNKQNLDKCPLT